MQLIAQTHLQLLAQLHAQGRSETELVQVGHAYLHAAEAVDGLYRGSGKPFLCHLVGTASIVARCSAPLPLLLAALLHALPQARVGRARQAGWRRGLACFGADVLRWVEAYDRHAGAADLGATERPPAEVELLLLADELEDLLDLGAWWHATGDGGRGTCDWRLRRAEDLLAERVERAQALGQPWLAEAFRHWTALNRSAGLPAELRTRAVSSATMEVLRCPHARGED